MKIEIAIEGPCEAVRALHRKLAFGSEEVEQGVDKDPQRAKLILVEEDERVNQVLIRISDIAERELRIAESLEFRVRNLAYSEPSPWCESLREPFQPVPSLTVRPWSPTASRSDDRHEILLDSDLAFGTGRHPTTQLCLKALQDLSCGLWGLSGKSVLDFGCGTALLAIAAAKLGASHCQAVEIDPEAAATAKRNVVLNGLSDRVVISQGSWEAVEGRVDLLLANLVPSVLLRTGSEIPAHLREQGRAVVSGFGRNQSQEVEDFFSRLGLKTTEHLERQEWRALVMEKNKA
ncbi:MAG: ribosomal protein methyltransferase [Deltaproteobacteria bacterium]|nr:ribosomal protein methyltransferase [Deltaproteobacteria bacterium]